LAVPVNGRLDRRRVLEAAVGLVDREGLEALSMRRLGRELGVEAMSLYNHVPSKDALLNGMVELLLSGLEVSEGEEVVRGGSGGWEGRVRRAFRSYLGLARAHPEVFPLFALRPLNTAESLRVFETLREAGFDNVTALRAFRALSSYTIGHALAEIREKSPDGPDAEPADRDAEFEFGLDLILAGLRAEA
jgi:AcrR family transcriptional regulator